MEQPFDELFDWSGWHWAARPQIWNRVPWLRIYQPLCRHNCTNLVSGGLLKCYSSASLDVLISKELFMNRVNWRHAQEATVVSAAGREDGGKSQELEL